MLKKMRRRFILSAMAAFSAIMLILVAGINLANYYQTAASQDKMITDLLKYEQRAFEHPKMGPPPMKDMPGGGPEAEFTTRFFTVHCDDAENIEIISRDHISSVDDATARAYTQAVLLKKTKKGYYKEYRYQISTEGSRTTILFLNVSGALHFMRSLFLVSSAIGIVSLLTVFILIVALSGYAIRPYAKNIERQKRFITDAGHELKTPLASIATSADIAAMEYENDEWITNIQKQTIRLSRLVENLVALSRLDEETPFPEKAAFSLSDTAWETAEPFAALAKAKGKKYQQNIEDHLVLCGDCSSIQQMISILLDNAVKYSDREGMIRFDLYRKRGKAFIEVFNTCCLPECFDPDRLFDRFYRLDESRSSHTGGTGIGLSMAQAIAQAHSGRIEIKCTDQKSILFKVVLPLLS